jgi:Golgi phosphoprotein 3 (GPP34)
MGHSEYAPNLFLVAHDSFTGRMEVSHELVLCGLVTAELAHLIIERRVGVADDRIIVTDVDGAVRPPVRGPEDEAGTEIDDYVVASIKQQHSTHSVRVWGESLGEVIYGLVADNLVEQGIVRRERRRGISRRTGDRFPAADLLRASGPRLRLDHMVREPSTFTLAGAVNVALLGALGIERLLEAEPSKEFLDELNRNLPTQLQALMAGAAAAAAAVSLTVRR